MRSIYIFWASFTLVTGIYYSTWLTSLSRMGFSLEDAAITYSFFVLGQALFEIPTGSIADKFGRKLITLVGVFLHSIAFLGVYFSSSKWSVYTCLMIAGFGQTLLSGAYHAWFLDVAEKASITSSTLFSNMDLIRRVNLVLGAIVGALVLNFDPRNIWSLMCFLSILSTILGIISTSDNISPPSNEYEREKVISLDWLRGPSIIGIMVMSMFYGIEIGNRDTIMQPFVVGFLGKGDPFGMVIIQAGVAIFGILGNRFGAKYRRQIPESFGSMDFQILMIPLAVMGLSQLLMSFSKDLMTFCLPYFIGIFGIGWFYPAVHSYLSKVINAKDRAKAFSALGMFESISASIACIVVSRSEFFNSQGLGKLWIVGSIALFMAFLSVLIGRMAFLRPEKFNIFSKI